MFLNVSAHPSAEWVAAQRSAAEALGGEVADQLFPEVPASASEADVAATGAGLIAEICAKSPAAVMVQGEFTLTFYLVRELQSRGIPCYAATTRRLSQVERRPDGLSRTLSLFEFVRFRRYA
jgi:CRISPR-associated protein Csx16